MLEDNFGDSYVPSPWLNFLGSRGVHWCQPDGLLFDIQRGVIAIVEIKYQHTTDAWWQLRRLYEPVLSALFPPSLWRFTVVEIVKWYDPQVPWPEPIRMLPQVSEGFALSPRQTGVHIWKP